MEKKLPKLQALKVCRSILANGPVIPSDHLYDRMNERNVEMEDVLRVIKTGSMPYDEPDINARLQEYKYKFVGKTVDGKKLRVGVGIYKDANKMIIITVF